MIQISIYMYFNHIINKIIFFLLYNQLNHLNKLYYY